MIRTPILDLSKLPSIIRTPIPYSNTTIRNPYELLLASLNPEFSIEDEDLTEEELEVEAEFKDLDPKFKIELSELTQEMVLESVAYFADSVLTGPNSPPYNGRFLIGDHHLEWDELLAYNNRVCVLSARDHGKSYFFDFAYPIRQAIKYPRECGFIFSSTQQQATEFLDIIKNEIESNPKLQYLVPTKKTYWGSKKITLANGHRIYARGFGVRVRGAHPIWIVVDDGLNDETAWSETVRVKQNDYFFNAITNMITPSGQIVVVGTPFHANDLYGELKKNKRYICKTYPAESKPGEVGNQALWEDRYSLEALHIKKDEIGTIRYGREFLVSPISDEMSLFPISLFKGSPVEQFNIVLGMPLQFWLDKGVVPYIGVDFAISSTVQADYTVITVLGLDDFGNRWLIDMFRKKGMSYQEQRSEINRLGRLYDPGLMALESNQMQRIFGDELIRETDLPIFKFTTTAHTKNSLEFGIPELRVLLENGKFRIPRGDARSIEMTDILIDEMRSMTFLEGKIQSVGQHDDCPMSCISPGTMVMTDKGEIPIECISIGQTVLTHKGNWKKVIGTMQRPYKGMGYNVSLVGSDSFFITSNHPIYSAKTKADYVNKTNRIYPIDWEFRNVGALKAGRKLNGDFGYTPKPRFDIVGTWFDLSKFIYRGRSKKGGNCWKVNEEYIWWRKDRLVPRFLRVDKDFAFLIGLYLAEGSCNGSHLVSLTLNRKESYIEYFFVKKIKALFKAVNGRIIRNNTRIVFINSKPLHNLFRMMGSHKNKGLPWGWMGWPIDIKLHIVKGWLVGDGCLKYNGNKDENKTNYLSGFSISRKLINQMTLILREFGINPSIRYIKNNGFNTDKYSYGYILTMNTKDTSKFLQELHYIEKLRWYNLNLPEINKNTNCRNKELDNGFAVRFKKIEKVYYEGDVYNLQVEGDESYTVNNVSVHNCWLANQAVKHGGFGFSFGDDVISTKQINIDNEDISIIPKSISKEELEIKKKYVMDNISKGHGITCTMEEYEVYRNILHEIADENIDNGNDIKSIIALEEIKRLDAQFNYGIGE